MPFSVSVSYSFHHPYSDSVPIYKVLWFFIAHEYFANSCTPNLLINVVPLNAANPFVLRLSLILDISEVIGHLPQKKTNKQTNKQKKNMDNPLNENIMTLAVLNAQVSVIHSQ